MPLETVSITVDGDSYTQIGDGVTALSVTETKVGHMKVHVVAAGGSAPTGASGFQEFNETFTYSGSSADIYVMTFGGDTVVGVIRE